MNKRIIWADAEGVHIIVPSAKWTGTIDELAKKDTPTGKSYKIINTSALPPDRTFRNAWEEGINIPIKINMPKAREFAHEARRIVRAKTFAPLDIKATIPSEAVAAEAERQTIRDNDAQLQIDIDKAGGAIILKKIMVDNGLI